MAAKSSVPQRRDAALKILDNMKEHSPKLVKQAMLVSAPCVCCHVSVIDIVTTVCSYTNESTLFMLSCVSYIYSDSSVFIY